MSAYKAKVSVLPWSNAEAKKKSSDSSTMHKIKDEPNEIGELNF